MSSMLPPFVIEENQTVDEAFAFRAALYLYLARYHQSLLFERLWTEASVRLQVSPLVDQSARDAVIDAALTYPLKPDKAQTESLLGCKLLAPMKPSTYYFLVLYCTKYDAKGYRRYYNHACVTEGKPVANKGRAGREYFSEVFANVVPGSHVSFADNVFDDTDAMHANNLLEQKDKAAVYRICDILGKSSPRLKEFFEQIKVFNLPAPMDPADMLESAVFVGTQLGFPELMVVDWKAGITAGLNKETKQDEV